MIESRMRRYYFEVTDANIIECIWAFSFTDAKSRAAIKWMPYWQNIKWINCK
jgi:hypothetical protein